MKLQKAGCIFHALKSDIWLDSPEAPFKLGSYFKIKLPKIVDNTWLRVEKEGLVFVLFCVLFEEYQSKN